MKGYLLFLLVIAPLNAMDGRKIRDDLNQKLLNRRKDD